MSFFDKILHPSSNSADVAKARLHLMLANDRSGISSSTLELVKDDIVVALSKHIRVDSDKVNVSVLRTPEGNHLVANIPLTEKRLSSVNSPTTSSDPTSSKHRTR